MKTFDYIKFNYKLFKIIILAVFLCSLMEAAYAQMPPEPPGGYGTNSGGGDPPVDPPSYGPSYGSNLWLEITGVASNAAYLNLHNTEGGIQYEIQSLTNLTQTNWISEGFVFGSEITNVTPTNILQSGRTDLFLRIRSWIDSYDIGIPDWWQLEYFGYIGIDPYADPAGDGYSNLYKYQNGLNPFVSYAPQNTLADAAPVANDNGVTISWDPAQGQVLSYTIYRNGSAIATVPATQFSYTDNSLSIDLTDPNDSDFPYYQVAANYSGASYLGGVQDVSNPRYAIATELVRGPGGQQVLLVPNIPYGVTAIRVYVQASGADYPDDAFDSLSYLQPIGSFNPTLSSNYFDVAVSSFTNGQYVIPTSLLPSFNGYTISCRALGPNGAFGADDSTSLNSGLSVADSEIPLSVPFVDGTEQLKENLAFALEAADENNPFAFGVVGDQYPEPPDYIFPANYAYAGFYFPLDFGDPQYNYVLLDPFKPFEDNDFLRNFVFASTNLNSDGSLASGVYYDPYQYPPIQIPETTRFSFPEYDYVTTGNTNDLQPLMSAVSNQWIYTAYEPNSPWQGNIGINEAGTNLFLGNGQYNIFGLEYLSAYQLFNSNGVSLYTNTLVAGGGSLPDESYAYSQYFYGQIAPPQLQTVGYFFGVPFQDYLPGLAGFNPTNTGPSQPQVLAVGESIMMSAWAKEQIANGTSGAIGFLEQYFDEAYLGDSDGNIDTNQPTGILSEYGEFFATDPGKTFLTTKTDTNGDQGQVPVYTIALCTDVNRDGTIDPSFGSPDFTTPAHPFHFWVNDNNDSGDDSGNDIPGYPATMHQTPNGLSGQVNGVRDLIDFFPVYIDVHDLLEAMQTNQLYSGLQFVLSQADGALNFVETTNPPDEPEAYLTDTNVASSVANLPVTQITSSGVLLNSSFLDTIRDDGEGIILVEAWTNTSNPLVLDVLQGTNIIAEAPLYLNVTGVEQMFRQKNLTSAVLGEVAGPPDRLNDYDVPNEPDTDGNNLIFVHGYNTDPNEARGAQSSMFRRMFWSGSQAKFYGVTWYGYQSRAYIDIPLLFTTFHFEITPNYHANVVDAFTTAPYLASFINSLSGTNTLAAHSLGNMVSLSALSDYGANVQNYFMIDAAVPMEAIDPTTEVNTNMVPLTWPDYYSRLWASYWYELWPSTDGRYSLAWNSRLDNFNGANVYNFYSSGEEVLRTQVGPPPTVTEALFDQAILNSVFSENPVGDFVWAWQEKMKGLTTGDWMLGSSHGGWKFNSYYSTDTVEQADDLPSSQLQTNTFFDVTSANFGNNDLALFGSDGSTYAQANRSAILADTIPAVTLPVGANPVSRLQANSQNFDMQASYENGWPTDRPRRLVGAVAPGEWHHSDYEDVAYLYTHGLFDQLVNLGNLQ